MKRDTDKGSEEDKVAEEKRFDFQRECKGLIQISIYTK